MEFLPNLRDFPISRDVGLGVGKSPYPAPVVVNFLKIKNFSKNRKKKNSLKEVHTP